MAQHTVDIGAHVVTSDGKDVGTVDQLIVRGDSNRVGGFLLNEHKMRTSKKIVPARAVASSDHKRVTLSLTEAEVDQLDNELHEQMLKAPGELTYTAGYGGLVDISGTGDTWMLRGNEGGQYPHTGSTPFFFEAPVGNVEVENISNLPEDGILLSEGTEVIGSDWKKVGHVDEVIVNDKGEITEFLVKAGWLFKHDVRIPISLVAGSSHEHVRLSVTADEAEAQGRS